MSKSGLFVEITCPVCGEIEAVPLDHRGQWRGRCAKATGDDGPMFDVYLDPQEWRKLREWEASRRVH